eukprot:15937998-Heterocapsa_arctica.AAC.1
MHAAWLHNRYQPRADGVTPFEHIQGRRYASPIHPFATPVMVRLPDALVQPKLDLRWVQGLWLGRKPETDEHIVGCRDKIRFGRS